MPTMHAIRTPPFGGPESMIHVAVERPEPGPHQLLVKVAAIGVNRADVMQRTGAYSPPPGESDILGLELSGDVIATGTEVSRFRSGQRVFGLVAAGAYAEYALVHEQLAVEIPEAWSYVQAAAVIEMFCTANETLFTLGELKAGERVLIHAAGSGIGSTAIQMARHVKAEVIATASVARKLEQARGLGASYAINYKERDFAEEIMGLTPSGVDVVEDFIGAAYFQRNLAVLRPLGRMVSVGVLGPDHADIDVRPILYKRLKVLGFTLRPQSIAEKTAIVARFVKRWMPPLLSKQVEPVMYAEVPFTKVGEAHRIMEAGENFGKIVMTVP
jgi:NADPH2:quinone reductase